MKINEFRATSQFSYSPYVQHVNLSLKGLARYIQDVSFKSSHEALQYNGYQNTFLLVVVKD